MRLVSFWGSVGAVKDACFLRADGESVFCEVTVSLPGMGMLLRDSDVAVIACPFVLRDLDEGTMEFGAVATGDGIGASAGRGVFVGFDGFPPLVEAAWTR